MVNSPTRRLAHSDADANSHGFPRRVRQTRALGVVGKGLRVVVSRSDDKYVNRVVCQMTSLSASWHVDELTCYRP